MKYLQKISNKEKLTKSEAAVYLKIRANSLTTPMNSIFVGVTNAYKENYTKGSSKVLDTIYNRVCGLSIKAAEIAIRQKIEGDNVTLKRVGLYGALLELALLRVLNLGETKIQDSTVQQFNKNYIQVQNALKEGYNFLTVVKKSYLESENSTVNIKPLITKAQEQSHRIASYSLTPVSEDASKVQVYTQKLLAPVCEEVALMVNSVNVAFDL